MNKEELSKILHIDTELYRYDLSDSLPNDWTTDYHSIEYSYDRGFKNKCGSFFFYDNEQTSLDVLKNAAQMRGVHVATITSCHTLKEVTLLDLSKYDSPSQLLCCLYKNGIDVFNKGFYCYDEDHSKDRKIDEMKESLVAILTKDNKTMEDMLSNINTANKINEFFYSKKCSPCKCRYLGQLFTDFDNGPKFKKMLLDKDYDGYCFREDPCGMTYCIFDQNVLSAPNHKTIVVNI